MYYSLFGKNYYYDNPDGTPGRGRLIEKVDKHIIIFATDREDENGISNKVYFHIDGVKNGSYPFVYEGQSFTSIEGIVSGKGKDDGTIFRVADPENSYGYICLFLIMR